MGDKLSITNVVSIARRADELAQKIAAAGKLPLGPIDELHRRLNTAAAVGSLGRKIAAVGKLPFNPAWDQKFKFEWLDNATAPERLTGALKP